MNFILPLILLLSSLGIFFGYVDTTYKGTSATIDGQLDTYGINKLKEEYETYQTALKNSSDVVANKEELINRRNSIPSPDQDRLARLLPDNIDNVKLIVEITEIAARKKLSLKNLSVGGAAKTSDTIGQDTTPYGVLSVKFSVNTTYENFLSFVEDLEKNLRLVDITDISFSSSDTEFYDFSLSLNTYWLK